MISNGNSERLRFYMKIIFEYYLNLNFLNIKFSINE
jgi:hypothetical protein